MVAPVDEHSASLRPLRALLIAEEANPQWTSVPLVGWCHARAIARLCEAHLVTQVRNRQALLDAGLVEGSDFTAINSESVARPISRLAWRLGGRIGGGWTTRMALWTIAYPVFEHLVWRRLGGRIGRGEFDVVHRLTPLSPTVPSPLARRCRELGVPFIWGPINGGVPWPRQFDEARRQEREWLSYLRQAHRLVPGYRATRENAAAILIGSGDTWRQMPRRYHDKCFYIPENAVEAGRFRPPQDRRTGLPLRVIFIGRLVPYKGADMLLEAAAPLVRARRMTLGIVGDGPQKEMLVRLARMEGLNGSVRFDGWVKNADIPQRLAEADVLALPSIREFGGGVVLEAMAAGVVPIVVDYGGPGELVTPACGFRIPLGPRQQIIHGYSAVLRQLIERPALLAPKAQAARARAAGQFTWDAKARQVLEIYEWALHRRMERPRFAVPMTDDGRPDIHRSADACISGQY